MIHPILLDINLERPRNRIALADNKQYNHYRHEVLQFLYEKQRKVESVEEHRKKQSGPKAESNESNVA